MASPKDILNSAASSKTSPPEGEITAESIDAFLEKNRRRTLPRDGQIIAILAGPGDDFTIDL